DHPVAVVARRERVAPVAEGPLRELHDVALVHEGDAPPPVAEREVDGRPGQALGAFARDRLDPYAARLRETDLLDPHLGLEERDDLRASGLSAGHSMPA